MAEINAREIRRRREEMWPRVVAAIATLEDAADDVRVVCGAGHTEREGIFREAARALRHMFRLPPNEEGGA